MGKESKKAREILQRGNGKVLKGKKSEKLIQKKITKNITTFEKITNLEKI